MNATKETIVKKWVAYYRVSTKRQGLGLDAQRSRVEAAAKESGAEIVAEIEEKESGKECDRPGLNRAMALARKNRATLVVAKADRLSRDLAFAASVFFNSNVEVMALDMRALDTTSPLLFGIGFAAITGLSNEERKLISERTKAALQALKASGVKLGRPDAAASITPEMVAAATEARKRKAAENPNNVASANEIRRYLSAAGKSTLQAIADHLTAEGFYTSRGLFHTPKSVSLLCKANGISLR